jgi:hypothetical protein
MLVNWTKDNIKGIPIIDSGSNVILAPGYNDVPTGTWLQVRHHVLDQIESGIIKEEWTRVKAIEAKVEEFVFTADLKRIMDIKDAPAEVTIPATLKDITRARVVPGIIKNTYHKPSLKKWLKEEIRDDVIKAINHQLEVVDNPALLNEE